MGILVADDWEPTRVLLHDTLEHWGYEPSIIVDGRSTWEALSSEDPPRIALLDWMMPAPDGPEICRRLAAGRGDMAPFVYVILLTSRSQSTDLAEALAAGAHDFISKPFDPIELHSRILAGEKIVEYEILLRARNEEIQRYATNMERLAEERAGQLIHAERLATIGTMSAAILHEIKNPLFVISANLAFQKDEIDSCDIALGTDQHADLSGPVGEIRQSWIQMKAGLERIERVIKSLSAFSRKASGKREPCSLNDCVRGAINVCESVTKHISVTQDLPGGLPGVMVSRQEIEQILVNLILNATQALDRQRNRNILVSTRRDGEGVTVSVEDNEPGMALDVVDRVFDAFFTTKETSKGTGLGLSISAQIAEDHGGRLTCENRDEGGARFTLWIPASQEENDAPSRMSLSRDPSYETVAAVAKPPHT